jgi:hypothetical protein
MVVSSIKCDKWGKIFAKESQEYYTINGIIKTDKVKIEFNGVDLHICKSCLIKQLNILSPFEETFRKIPPLDDINRDIFTPNRWDDIRFAHFIPPVTCKN